MNYTQRRITVFSATFGLLFGVMTIMSMLMSGMSLKSAFASGMISFAVSMLTVHIAMSVKDALEVRRYEKFEQSLGGGVQAHFEVSIFFDNMVMGGMAYAFRDKLLLASLRKHAQWKVTLLPGEMHHAEQLDPATLQLNCLDGRVFRIVSAFTVELIDELRAMGISVVELPIE